jgi:hypothetical protein
MRGNGLVGRSAAAQALNDQAITLAVVASVLRHEDTDYDILLMSGTPRAIDRLLRTWAGEGRPSQVPVPSATTISAADCQSQV